MPIKILENDTYIVNQINELIAEHFIEVLKIVKPKLENRFRYLIINAIKTPPEYESLLRGRLLGEFGLSEAQNKLSNILDILSKEIFTSISGSRKTPIKLTIFAIKSAYENILASDAAKQITNKGQSLDWLDWLLIQGDKTIIRDYEIVFNTTRPSRTGQAIMVNIKRGKWGVPPQYAGTKNNNWITRSIDSIDDNLIQNIIQGEVEKEW